MHKTCIATFREWFVYEAATGSLRWRKSPRYGIAEGGLAGSKNKRGYMVVCVCGSKHYVHRVIWVLAYGAWPEHVIDHIDGDKQNNRLENLRDISQALNVQNKQAASSAGSTGLLGVSRARGGRFAAFIGIGRRNKYLGQFKSASEAHQAYLTAKRQLHPASTI